MSDPQFPIHADRVVWYFRIRIIPFLIPLGYLLYMYVRVLASRPGLMTFLSMTPLWFFLAMYLVYTIWIARKQAYALRYWLEDSTLRVDEGIVTMKRKSIPLDRITDVVLVQSVFMRLAGIWSLKVQTAGSSDQRPEAELFGILQPEAVRDEIMQSRDSVVGIPNQAEC